MTTIPDLIANHAGCDPADVLPNVRLVEDLGMDSMDLAELALAIEEDFLGYHQIPDDEIDRWKTAEDVQKCVDARVARQ